LVQFSRPKAGNFTGGGKADVFDSPTQIIKIPWKRKGVEKMDLFSVCCCILVTYFFFNAAGLASPLHHPDLTSRSVVGQ
jgi:hypothetical protein